MRLCNTTDGMFTSVVVLLTFAGLASSIIWDTLAGGSIGLKGARSVAVGGCNFTLIVYSVQYSVYVHVLIKYNTVCKIWTCKCRATLLLCLYLWNSYLNLELRHR